MTGASAAAPSLADLVVAEAQHRHAAFALHERRRQRLEALVAQLVALDVQLFEGLVLLQGVGQRGSPQSAQVVVAAGNKVRTGALSVEQP